MILFAYFTSIKLMEKRNWMSNCKSVGQNQRESVWGGGGRERERRREREKGRETCEEKEFTDYFDWCVVGSWWLEEELPKAEGALRQHEEGKIVKCFCSFLGCTMVPSLLLGSLQNCEEWPSSYAWMVQIPCWGDRMKTDATELPP